MSTPGHRHMGGRTGCTELSATVCARPFTRDDDELAGFLVAHERAGRPARCEGAVWVNRRTGEPGPVWKMSGALEDGDLTLSPSIMCLYNVDASEPPCGFHGFIRDGEWVPA